MSGVFELNDALKVLRGGGSILYPTDTIWGIGCDATNGKAVDKVYRIKERMAEKSMIILVSDLDMLREYVEEIPEIAEELIASVTEPLTIIYPGARNLPRNIISGDGSIAVRIPMHDYCMALLEAFGRPVSSTSANMSGMPNPLSFRQISEEIKAQVDYTVDEKHQQINRMKPSTIVKIDASGDIRVLRN